MPRGFRYPPTAPVLSSFSNASSGASVEQLLAIRGEAGSIISKGLYAYHLREWLEYYPKEQLLVLLFEDFYKNVRASLRP